MTNKQQTSWMWHNDASNGVQGAAIIPQKRLVLWFDEPGCACAGSHAEQRFTDFLQNGPRYIVPPADILEEIRDSIMQQQALHHEAQAYK